MKVTIKINYAGEEKTWKDLDFEDGTNWEEVWDNFMVNYSYVAIDQATGEEVPE